MTSAQPTPRHAAHDHAEPGPDAPDRSPEELRGDLDELRSELGDTVEELAHRADVPARVRAKREETTERVQVQVAQARATLAEKAPAVESALGDRRTLAGIVGLVVSYLLVSRLRRRSQRRKAARAQRTTEGGDSN